MKNFTRLVLALAVVCLAGAPLLAAGAQTPPTDTFKAPAPSGTPVAPAAGTDKQPSAAPDPHANPVLADFMKNGVKVYYLGMRGDLNGWFLFKDNQIQIAYSPPDNRDIIFGALYDAMGSNISADQIKALYDSNKEVYALLTNYNNAQAQITAKPGQPQLPGSPTMASASDTSQLLLPPATTTGERLMHALQNAEGVDLGAATSPKIYMIADPNCPHCQATWKMLRGAVLSGKIQVRIVPIGALGTPESERAAAQFLRSANPLDAWDKYITAGDQSQLAGTPDTAALTAVRNNHAVIDSWHIEMTPYMVYRSKQGQMKIEQGEPHDPETLINDVGL